MNSKREIPGFKPNIPNATNLSDAIRTTEAKAN
jgi:hypothetical protein